MGKSKADQEGSKDALSKTIADLTDHSDTPLTPKLNVDVEQAFMLYATFCGDLERTAHALRCSPVDVLRLADKEHWNEKLRGILELKKTERSGDVERQLSRAMNFVQAHRMRLFLERILQRLYAMQAEELDQYLLSEEVTKTGKKKRTISTRAFADLAAAIEKCQLLTYYALNDTTSERKVRVEADDQKASVTNLHTQIANALAEVRASDSPRALLFQQTIAEAEKLAAAALKGTPDPNRDILELLKKQQHGRPL